MNEKKIILIILAIMIVGVLGWIFYESRPKPGQLIDDLGRGHVPVGTEVKYNTNPPTSGPHFEDWVKAGVYERPQDDRYLLHSLEHGYVIISYNCGFNQSFRLIPQVWAHGIDESLPDSTGSGEDATASGLMSEQFKSDECHELVDQLTKVIEDKGKRKLILTPRPSLDATIALTAWRKLDKFNQFNDDRIKKFIDSLRDQGPEKTAE